ncbi:MAG: glycosyltransferase [Streptosporangiaceae bacterium]
MRVLILGPVHSGGSLPPYLDALAAGLAGHGVTAVRAGSAQIPYDQARQEFWPADRVAGAARALARETDPGAFDLVALNAGNLEYDQLVPAIWAAGGRAVPPLVHHVHTLAPTLFRDHVPDPRWYRAARDAARDAGGHVWFGQYARRQMAGRAAGAPGRVAWLPTTIPPGTVPAGRPALAEALDTALPVISLYGYAALWKDAGLLLAALGTMRAPARIVLAGDFWDDPAQAGLDLSAFTRGPARAGRGELAVVPGYLGPADRAALVHASAAGVFPYRPHASFQGSGAIADYLAHGVPVIATSVANMAELAGDAGIIVPAGGPQALAAALDVIAIRGGAAAGLARRAAARAGRFTAGAHAAGCLAVYREALGGDGRKAA